LDDVAAKESGELGFLERSKLIPGLVESSPEGLAKVGRELGVVRPEITKNHMGHHHVRQPWEEKVEEEEKKEKEKKIPATMNITKKGALVLPPRECPEWGATQNGCECLDTCECAEPYGPKYALVRRCKTRMVKSESDGSETQCGDPEFPGAPDWYDYCLVHTTPFPRPVLQTVDPTFEHDPDPKIWRNWDAHKNKRFLPKSACYSRDQYCASFPMFTGCDPSKTQEYTHLIRSHLSDEQQAVVDKCKKIKKQEECEEAKQCGKGKDRTCHHTCVWTEDAPMWFRTMRGKGNMKIKKSRKDPAVVGIGDQLPVLQPGPGVNHGEFGVSGLGKMDSGPEIVIKKSDKRDKAGAHLDREKQMLAGFTTPMPLAGDTGTRRSQGWGEACHDRHPSTPESRANRHMPCGKRLPAGEVGDNVGNDNTAVGLFRPRRGENEDKGHIHQLDGLHSDQDAQDAGDFYTMPSDT
jgi:hypothetical protein